MPPSRQNATGRAEIAVCGTQIPGVTLHRCFVLVDHLVDKDAPANPRMPWVMKLALKTGPVGVLSSSCIVRCDRIHRWATNRPYRKPSCGRLHKPDQLRRPLRPQRQDPSCTNIKLRPPEGSIYLGLVTRWPSPWSGH